MKDTKCQVCGCPLLSFNNSDGEPVCSECKGENVDGADLRKMHVIMMQLGEEYRDNHNRELQRQRNNRVSEAMYAAFFTVITLWGIIAVIIGSIHIFQFIVRVFG